jgi:hypothetical protein
MNYRLLSKDEWGLLKDMGGPVPTSDTAICAGAFNDAGELKGVLFLQLVAHMEPLVLTDPSVSFLRLAGVINEQVGDALVYYVFAPDAKIARMAELNNMQDLGYRVYERTV